MLEESGHNAAGSVSLNKAIAILGVWGAKGEMWGLQSERTLQNDALKI